MASNSAFQKWLFIFSVSLSLLYSCDSSKDTDKDGIPDKSDKCPKVAASTADGCPLPQKIAKIHLFVETSISMGGYFKNDAEYKTIISDLAVKVDKTISPIDIWFVGDSMFRYKGSPVQFSSDIATTKIANNKSSELHEIISNIAAKTDSNDVSILISDCILSFPNAVVKANANINKTEAPNALKNKIYGTFSDLKKRGLGTTVYAFTSKFYGNYYDFQNVKTKLNGESRPFYIWVIGSTGILTQFDEHLSEISSFKPDESLHFGLIDSTVTDYKIISQIEKKGAWKKDGEKSLEDVNPTQAEPVQFCLALDLSKLPSYARQKEYLQEHLEVITNGCKAAVLVKTKSEADNSKLKSQKQKLDLESSTNIVIVSVKDMNLAKGNIQLLLPQKYDTWYERWSCDDDKVPALTINKTFAFKHLINGVIEAYDTKNKNYIDLHIALNK